MTGSNLGRGLVWIHQEFGIDWGVGVNFKRIFDTDDEIGYLDCLYKADNSEVTVSFLGLREK